MTDEELIDALDGLMAYDVGATDSGIHDEALRQRCKDEIATRSLRRADDGTHRYDIEVVLAKYGAARLERGSLADIKEFIEWLDGRMGFSV